MLRPIHQMTPAEFEALPDDIRFLYPTKDRSWGPSHTNYYTCEILYYCQQGGRLSVRVWESLSRSTRSYITFAVGKTPVVS